MSSNHVDERDAELETLLRATFAGEAHRQVPDARSVPPFPETERVATVHPLRRRWTGVVLVAAALVGIIVGGTLIGREAMDARPSPSTPAGTSVAPTPMSSVTPSASTISTQTAPATSAVSTPPAPTTKQVAFNGVTLTVPTSWNLLTGSPGARKDSLPEACLSTGQTWAITGSGTDTCELRVQIGMYPDSGFDVDLPGLYGQGGGSICGAATGIPERTVTADEVDVDGWTAERRVFTAGCLKGELTQWTVATAPLIAFSRANGVIDPAASAAAEAVVLSAKLPGPRSELRVFDRGVITSLTPTSLQLDRQILRIGGQGVIDSGLAPISYPVSANVVVTYTEVGPEGFNVTLSVDDLRSLLAGIALGRPAGHTTPALNGVTAMLTTDGSHVTAIDYVEVG